MKFLMTAAFVLSQATLAAVPALANPSNCYSISNADSKNYCLALAKGEKSYCYSIGNTDKKNLCLAQATGQKSYCYSISHSDSKNQCLGMVR